VPIWVNRWNTRSHHGLDRLIGILDVSVAARVVWDEGGRLVNSASLIVPFQPQQKAIVVGPRIIQTLPVADQRPRDPTDVEQMVPVAIPPGTRDTSRARIKPTLPRATSPTIF